VQQLTKALRRARRLAVRSGGERTADSGMTSIEFVFLTPILFLMIFLCVQFSMYFFAERVAQASAENAARTARAEAAVPADSQSWRTDADLQGHQFLQSVGGSLLSGVLVNTADNGDGTVTSTVTGKAVSIIPGFSLSVSASSSGPIERFITDGP